MNVGDAVIVTGESICAGRPAVVVDPEPHADAAYYCVVLMAGSAPDGDFCHLVRGDFTVRPHVAGDPWFVNPSNGTGLRQSRPMGDRL